MTPADGSTPNPPQRSPIQSVLVASFSSVADSVDRGPERNGASCNPTGRTIHATIGPTASRRRGAILDLTVVVDGLSRVLWKVHSMSVTTCVATRSPGAVHHSAGRHCGKLRLALPDASGWACIALRLIDARLLMYGPVQTHGRDSLFTGTSPFWGPSWKPSTSRSRCSRGMSMDTRSGHSHPMSAKQRQLRACPPHAS